jgi:lysophospholipase L1-like esterase
VPTQRLWQAIKGEPVMPRYLISCLALVIVAVAVLALPPAAASGEPVSVQPTSAPGGQPDYDWVAPMRQVHAKFKGKPGTLAHFGDSITVTLAFWTPLLYKRANAPADMEQAYQRVFRHVQKDCWRDWKGPQFGSEGSMTIRWAQKNIDAWLAKLNPEAASLMFGTNDLGGVPLKEYEAALREVLGKCLANGTVVVLFTIPPRHRFDAQCPRFVEVQRQVARELKLPLIDFYAEILRRRPDDWDGATAKFAAYSGYDCPTLISRDGVHPSNPKQYDSDFSDASLNHNGFALRNYLTLMRYDEVLRRVLTAAASQPAEGR